MSLGFNKSDFDLGERTGGKNMANPILVTGAAGRDGQCGSGGEASRRESVHQYVADDALPDEHYRNHREPAAEAALARRAGAELVRSAGRARAADSAPRRLLPDSHSGFG